MRTGSSRRWLVGSVWLLLTACASTPHRMVARSVTAAQWSDVVECVERNGRTSETWVDRAEDGVRVGRNLETGGMEEIWFRRGMLGAPTFAVRSSATVVDPRRGRQPMDGPSSLTRRLRQQLDVQCLSQYPSADGAGATP